MNKIYFNSFITFLSALFLTTFVQASRLSPTIYYIKTIDLAQKCDSKKTIFGADGKSLLSVCQAAYQSCVIEGTCAFEKDEPASGVQPMTVDQNGGEATDDEIDYEVINYVKSVNGRPVFMPVDEQKCPWGYGVSQICLDPFYSLAADLQFHKAGEVLYIEKLKGTKLPNGEIHEGFMIIRDRGGAIKGPDRFDFYTGLLNYRDEKNPFTPLGFATSSNKIEYRKATSEEADQFRKKRNFPGIPHSN